MYKRKVLIFLLKHKKLSRQLIEQNIPDNRISVPPVQPPVSSMNVPQGATNVGKKGKDEKEISMFHLLMHYSKENKEKYRQQKQEKNSRAKKVTM